jgi:hypothetical protein
MSNPFETPSGAFASSGVDARVNPFARQVGWVCANAFVACVREQCARIARARR